MNRSPTMGNLFSGSGAWELAAEMCGIDVIFESEIEPFPVRLEAKRFPNAIQLGDVSKINGANVPAVDILTNSSPCQDLSIAGSRKGLDGARSGLFIDAVRIAKEMRAKSVAEKLRSGGTTKFVRPRFWCWENVPGAFSSSKGEDFRSVLNAVASIVEEKHADIPVPRGGGITQESWMVSNGRSRGGSWTLNFGESRKDEEGSSLSQILEDIVPPKYFLSSRACLGILRRSEKSGKELPSLLKIALKRQIELSQQSEVVANTRG